ncbi:alpha/beta hydrolase [Filibacter tadaridae]|uniref:2-hydroxymuconate semialdehyde hydrolase n=1 Tax=Filibacter tadaridae TaxID=2483811 RepID=A0A3P5XCE2_9BACL|nr:alpha/beta hydrolase [Filibacter tadaridae]VDC32508.1 2-hydroxymuconate semialdehyde hydrolase [Filibacter tadaridae]
MWQKKLIDTSRGKFELFEKGKGEPLCVTHLYSAYDDRGNTFANPFTEAHHVYLINLRGCGNSVGAEEESQYSMTESVKDLEAVRLALGIEKWGFAGHSTGGMLALAYAIQAPASLAKIVAGGAAAGTEYGADPDSIYCPENANFNRIIDIMDRLNDASTPLKTRRQLGREWALMSYYSEEQLEKALEIPNSGKTVGDRLDYFRKIECKTYDLREALTHVTVPSFIYAGKHDAQCPYKFGVEIADLIPNATLTTFEMSNHNPFVEEEEKFKVFVESTL